MSLVLALGGGLAWGASFGESVPWPLPVLALVPLFLLLERPRAGWFGWLFGVVSWCTAMPWIVPTLTTYGFISGWLATLALVLLAAYLGAYHAAFAALGTRLWRRSGFAWLALPALWIVLEELRGVLLSGFPWNPAAHAWLGLTGALPLSSWIGATGVSGLLVLSAAAVARTLAGPERRFPIGVVLAVSTLLAVAARWATPEEAPGDQPLRVAIIQPNIANMPVFDPDQAAANFSRLGAMSQAACTPGTLLVWPESAAWPWEYPEDMALRQLVEGLVERGCSVAVNTPTPANGRLFNSLVLVSPNAATARYDKRHLVPFGEYVPLKSALPFLGKIARAAGDFSPARSPQMLALGSERLGAAICFEVIFPREVAEQVRAGATILVSVSNDAWYGESAAPWQHLAAARFRAAESRRPLVRAAITGVSAIVGPDGELLATLGVGEEGTLRAALGGRTDLSPFTRTPWLVPLLAALVAAAALLSRRKDRSA